MAYGFEIRNTSGAVVLDSSDTTFRIVYKRFCTWNYSSSFSVPDFDSNFGGYYIQPHISACAAPSGGFSPSIITTGTNYTYNFAGTQTSTGGFHDAGYYLTYLQSNKPTLSWNNSTKTMSVTSAAGRPCNYVNIGFGSFWDNGGDYSIVFFEVK